MLHVAMEIIDLRQDRQGDEANDYPQRCVVVIHFIFLPRAGIFSRYPQNLSFLET
jgi:hypothetical protein